jgi:hypothetical protein
MNALLVLIIAGFTAAFSAICFRRAYLIETRENVDVNLLVISAQEFTGAGIVFGIMATMLVLLSIVIASLNRR